MAAALHAKHGQGRDEAGSSDTYPTKWEQDGNRLGTNLQIEFSKNTFGPCASFH